MKSYCFIFGTALFLSSAGLHLATPAGADTGIEGVPAQPEALTTTLPPDGQPMWSGEDPPETPPPDYDDPCDHVPDAPGCVGGPGSGPGQPNCNELQGLQKCYCECERTYQRDKRICPWLPFGGPACERSAQRAYEICRVNCVTDFPNQTPVLPGSSMACVLVGGVAQ